MLTIAFILSFLFITIGLIASKISDGWGVFIWVVLLVQPGTTGLILALFSLGVSWIPVVNVASPYAHLADTGEYLRKAVQEDKDILFESANGIHLDIDHGTFPFVTSSAVGPAGIPQSCGLPNLHIDRIVGVMKCYMTRVGAGPFPTELVKSDDPQQCYSNYRKDCSITNPCNHCIANEIREKGKEYGTTTGRPRRIGWLDLDLTKRAVELTGATDIALMHVDTLTRAVKEVQVKWKDEYFKMPCWESPLDVKLSEFRDMIENRLGIPVCLISHGPGRTDVFPKQEWITKFLQETA